MVVMLNFKRHIMNVLSNLGRFLFICKKNTGCLNFVTISKFLNRSIDQHISSPTSSELQKSLFMKNWQKILAFAFMAAILILESCHRGYGCPGADL